TSQCFEKRHHHTIAERERHFEFFERSRRFTVSILGQSLLKRITALIFAYASVNQSDQKANSQENDDHYADHKLSLQTFIGNHISMSTIFWMTAVPIPIIPRPIPIMGQPHSLFSNKPPI